MLKLRRGVVIRADPLTIRVAGRERPAWADEGLVGEMREGDDVIVNTEALDLDLGSGGFDVVHANLTRGLRGKGDGGAAAMKLNYTSLQHSVEPVEAWGGDGVDGDDPTAVRRIPVLVIALHGQLAPAIWAARRARPRMRVGYVQTGGGALPGALSDDVAELRGTELICGQITVSPAHGGEHEAITTIGALGAAAGPLGWDAVVAGPGPGIVGSGTPYGNGGLAALDTAHASLALGLETLLAPRMSEGDPRGRHRGLSHHTETVLGLLLQGVRVPAPAERFAAGNGDGPDGLGRLRAACGERHELSVRDAPVDEYASSGLPSTTMGREIEQDRLFYAAALAAGDALGAAAPVEAAR